jgi:intracellular sulfur oxidation DsrE/DsrF family protein
MKKLVFIILMTLIVFNISAKSSKSKSKESVHKIVFQLTTNDTLAHKSLMKQLNNITSVAPTTKIEVVCHGPGLDMLVSDKTIVLEKIKQLKAIGVDFVACEFSIKERNVPIEKIIPEAGFVKAGIIEIVTKQEQGWSYIKSGF